LIRDDPSHPYALLDVSVIRTAMKRFLTFLEENNYPHDTRSRANVTVMTPVGTTKPTYAVPHTMRQGLTAWSDRRPCLIADFNGLKGFSARQIAACQIRHWPDLKTIRINFPETKGELYTERAARAMELPGTRDKLVAALKPHLGTAQAVGLPAVLGIHKTVQIMEDLQQGLGLPVFEIPTMLPAVTGLRLKEIFEQQLPAMGIRTLFQQRVLAVQASTGGGWRFEIGSGEAKRSVVTQSAILCSGRFFGKGLHADRHGIRETIFNLPVIQPDARADWHNRDLLDPRGHPVNRAGLAVDNAFRPVNRQNRPIFPNLFAAGSILANQDWIRQKCGSGLAIATAYGAVKACQAYIGARACS
jgi:glycerol-3-phosphate dehydrogenase subunit B